MKRILLLSAACIIFSAQIYTPAHANLNAINRVAEKKRTTWEDGVAMYVVILGRPLAGFNANVNTLKRLGILKQSKNYARNKVLNRGMMAGMIVRHLKLKDSLLYLIFRTERYAYRACVAAGIMDFDSSEWERLSGEELLEVMRLVGERME
jgi:hypothetical protein